MLDLQIQSQKEIWEAKKILYESNSATRRAFITSLATLVNNIYKYNLRYY